MPDVHADVLAEHRPHVEGWAKSITTFFIGTEIVAGQAVRSAVRQLLDVGVRIVQAGPMTEPVPGQHPGEVEQDSDGGLHVLDEQLGDAEVDVVLAELEDAP
jgi:hypothetical protein